MAIISRGFWKIHENVIEFWEKTGKQLCCYGDYGGLGIYYQGESIYFIVGERPPISVSSGDDNVIAKHSLYNNIHNLKYKFNDLWYSEEQSLRRIKLKAFL